MSWKWVAAVAVVVVMSFSCGQTAAAASTSTGTVSVTVQIRRPQSADHHSVPLAYSAIAILSQLQARQIRSFW